MKSSNLPEMLKRTWPYFFFLAVLIVVRTYFYSIAVVRGDSMSPAFQNGDLVLIEKWSRSYAPGDVVIFFEPSSNLKFIKRIVAGENSEIYIDQFRLYVNRVPFQESVDHPPTWDRSLFDCRFSEVFKTQTDEFFVMGDNRCRSNDSRYFGPVAKTNLLGKVSTVLVPSRWNFLKKYFSMNWEEDSESSE